MENIYDLQIARIQKKLSATQGVWLYPRATIDQVESAERSHNIKFPLAYRRFLLEVGDGGWLWTWPLYPLAKALAMVEGHLDKPYPFTGNFSDDEELLDLLSDEHLEYDLDGALTIFYFGCTHSDILVMNGPYVGTVTYDGRGTDQGFIPHSQDNLSLVRSDNPTPKSKRLDYLGWFERKLDNGI